MYCHAIAAVTHQLHGVDRVGWYVSAAANRPMVSHHHRPGTLPTLRSKGCWELWERRMASVDVRFCPNECRGGCSRKHLLVFANNFKLDFVYTIVFIESHANHASNIQNIIITLFEKQKWPTMRLHCIMTRLHTTAGCQKYFHVNSITIRTYLIGLCLI